MAVSDAPRSTGRRPFSALLMLFFATIACGGAIYVGERTRTRIDLTAAGEHTLAQRTRAQLDRLEDPHEIIVLAESAKLDPESRRLIADLLDAYDSASDRLSVTWIDPAQEDGPARYESLFRDRLIPLYSDRIDAHAQAVEQALEHIRALEPALSALSDATLAARDALPSTDDHRATLDRVAAQARLRANEIPDLVAQLRRIAVLRAGDVEVADARAARSALAAPTERLAADLDASAQALSAVSSPAEAASLASAAAASARALRDEILRAGDVAADLEQLQLAEVVRTLRDEDAVLVVSPRGVRGVRFSALFPPEFDASAGRAAVRFAGEEMIARAIASLDDTPAPIVVLVHAVAPLLDEEGTPAGDTGRTLFARLIGELRAQRIDVLEWAVASAAQRPSLRELDPNRDRPVVWVVIPSFVASPSAASGLAALTDALSALIADGQSVLLSLEPSTLPRIGEPDPMIAPLERFGIEPDTGHPLLTRLSTPRGPIVWHEFQLASGPGQHPIADATASLRTVVGWPIPITLTDTPGAIAAPLLRVPDSQNTWGESQWLSYRTTPLDRRASVPDPPSPDSAIDLVNGPWTVAACAQTLTPSGGKGQRIVVVGSNGWFFDPILWEFQQVDGRPALANPGNFELFQSSIYWLSFRDEMIAPSPHARLTPRIGSMPASRLAAIRWGIVLGLPVAVLLLGLAVRALRPE